MQGTVTPVDFPLSYSYKGAEIQKEKLTLNTATPNYSQNNSGRYDSYKRVFSAILKLFT